MASAKMRALGEWLAGEENAGKLIYPAKAQWLRALELTPLDEVKVVILGQDPYHGEGQAHGLAFSVPYGVKIPPSLVNIHKELVDDLGISPPLHGNLESWARESVLLLNTSLSVESAQAGSHAKRGWEGFTDTVIAAAAQREAPCVFILWGGHAQKKAALIEEEGKGRHLILTAPHPSPLSVYRGFFGSRPFSKANAFLSQHGLRPVNWRL